MNVLYLDKELIYDALIQAISRTNRVYDNTEKPMGLVKFYRKRYTMKNNLDEALALYCQGEKTDVIIADIDENIEVMNVTFKNISDIFAADNINNFEQLPRTKESQQKFRKEFNKLKRTMRIAMLQGLKWENPLGKRLDFDERTYRILHMRHEDLPPLGGGGGGRRTPRSGFNMQTHNSTIELDKIDADYLEEQFRIITMQEITEQDELLFRQERAISEIKKLIAELPQNKQKYAKAVLDDLRRGILIAEKGKHFSEYVQEYRDRAVRGRIERLTDEFDIDFDAFFALYTESADNKVNTPKLQALVKTANIDKAMSYFNTDKAFEANTKLFNKLMGFIENREAENDDR